MGQAHHVLYVSIAMAVTSTFSEKDYVEDRVEFLLAILPRGTKLVKTEEAMQGELLKRYVLTFEHPILVDDDQIKLTFARVAWEESPGKITQESVLERIDYAKGFT